MTIFIRTLLLSAILGGAALFTAPAPARADDYWAGHWQWYDTAYRPYYYNQRLYGRQYGYYGPYDPGPYYGGPGYYRYRDFGPNYGPYYGGNYYGTPNIGYREYPGRGGSVSVGPIRYGWR